MHNFKYHSVDDLERLIENLRTEVELLRKTADATRLLKESEDLLRHAEFELLERTLLQKPNDGGCSN
jgi:hypothetical protein